jgi:predicted type IV restriction endonuclease
MLLVGAALLWFGFELAASANQQTSAYVTMADMERYFITRGLTALMTLIGGIWLIYGAFEKSKARADDIRWRTVTESMANMANSITILAKSLKDHNEDADAHPVASRENHEPIFNLLTKLEAGQISLDLKLTRLIAEHEIIRDNECRILQVRNNRYRSSDSEDDIAIANSKRTQ